jgi:hypothetical protein
MFRCGRQQFFLVIPCLSSSPSAAHVVAKPQGEEMGYQSSQQGEKSKALNLRPYEFRAASDQKALENVEQLEPVSEYHI